MTRAQVESILVGRRRHVITMLGMSTATDGSNPDLSDPIARAVRQLGGTTADPSTAVDAEIDSVMSSFGEDRMLDAAEIFLIDRMLGNWIEVDFTLDGRTENLSDLLNYLGKELDRLSQAYMAKYGSDPGTPDAVPTILGGRLIPTPWAGLSPWHHGYRHGLTHPFGW